MSYRQFKPDATLSPYIDAFWEVTSDDSKSFTERIMPDCCIDIIVNLGTDVMADGSGFMMKNERVYLIGTMTRYKDTIREPGTRLIGIRFKPAGFSHFYNYGPLQEFTDTTVEFEKNHIPPFHIISRDFTEGLNHFFLKKLSPGRQSIFQILEQVYERRGQIHVVELAKNNFMTLRQLERIFIRHMGISPKAFINFVRYQFAIQNIRQNYPAQSLVDLSFDCGYYDHAHLANEIKKYSGISPSQL
ncbi:MAG TPA: helix-turn-helix transcriptional regulator [Puia sp.]|nr:helix-turn-helix transcriptional regulator [Puia sp.]